MIAIQVDAWYKMKTEQEEINSYLLSIQREFEIEIYWIEEIKLKSLKDQLRDLNSMTRILINQETDSLDYIINYASELDKNKGLEFFDFPIVDEFIQLDYLVKIKDANKAAGVVMHETCLLYTSPSQRDGLIDRMPSYS